MGKKSRERARALAREHLERGDACGWFEPLYAEAQGDAGIVPWADLVPNPGLIRWLEREDVCGDGRRALKVGCGLGDDAECLADRGFVVTAFDISPTAIGWCRKRFPASGVEYAVEDLFAPPGAWINGFDFVLESYTLQVLPPALRQPAMKHIAGFAAPGGRVLVITRARERSDPEGQMPWPLRREEVEQFRRFGLSEKSFEDYVDDEDPPVRRFRVEYVR